MPSQPNQYPAGALTSGTTSRATILQNHVFASGIHQPEVSKTLSYIYPQYVATQLLDKLDYMEPVSQSIFDWYEQDRSREGGTVAAVAGNTTDTATFQTTFPYAGDNLGYLIPGDVIMLQSGAKARVTATDANGGVQRVTVVRQEGGDWTVALLANDMVWGHTGTAFAEGTSGPKGRLHTPKNFQNATQIFKRGGAVSGTELTNKTWFGEEGQSPWISYVEQLELAEFFKDIEIETVFGRFNYNAATPTANSMKGLFGWIDERGQKTTYASASLTEAVLVEHISKLVVEGASNDLVALCGIDFLRKVQLFLKDYEIYRDMPIAGRDCAGIDFSSYTILGKKVHFAHYPLFNDPKVVPFAGTPASGLINFRDFSMWLDMGSDDTGRSLITRKYKNLDGEDRKFIYTVVPGMHGGNSGISSNTFDGYEYSMLADLSLEVRNANRMGFLFANS